MLTQQQRDRLEHLRLVGTHLGDQLDAAVQEAATMIGIDLAVDLVCNGSTVGEVTEFTTVDEIDR